MKNKSNASLSLRKLLLSLLVAAPLVTLPVPLWALPATQTALNGQINAVSAGVTVTSTNANRVDVTTTAANSVIKWLNFGDATNMTIGATDVINYAQPTTSSSVLNMVTGSSTTTIDGKLLSNGQLYVMNPNGVTVSGTGVITASAVGLSTVPETEFNLLANGTLLFVANQTTTSVTSNDIAVSGTITAASGTGNIWIAGKNVTVGGGTLDGGSVWLNSQNGGAVTLASTGALTIGDTVANASNLTVKSAAAITIGGNGLAVYGPTATLTAKDAAISQTGAMSVGAGSGANATVTASSGTGAISFADVHVNGTGTLTVNATSTGSSVAVGSSAGNLAIGGKSSTTYTASSAGDLTVNAITVGGNFSGTAAGNISSGGNAGITGTATLTAANGKNITVAGNVTGGLSFVASAGTLGKISITATKDLALPAITAANLTATTAGNLTQAAGQTITGGVVSLSADGNATISQAIAAKDISITTTTATSLNHDITTSVTLSPTGNATFSSAGALSLAAVTAGGALTATSAGDLTNTGALDTSANNKALTLTSTGGKITLGGTLAAGSGAIGLTASGNITQGGTDTITTTGTLTVDGAYTDLSTASNPVANLVVKNNASGAKVKTSGDVTLASGTAAAGNVTIVTAAGAAAIGAASADTISVNGALNIDTTATASKAITEGSNNVTVGGAVTLKTNNASVWLAPTKGVASTNNSYGQVNITSAGGSAAVYENTSLDLGAINLGAGGLTAYSRTSISNSAALTIDGAILVGAGTATAPGAVALTFDNSTASSSPTWNAITGQVKIMDDLYLNSVDTNTATPNVIGNYLASSVAITDGVTAASLITIPANAYGAGLSGPVTLTATKTASLTTGPLVTTGQVWLNSGTGSITANDSTNNTFTNVVVTTATTGAVDVQSSKDLTVGATVNKTATGTVNFASKGAVTIGSYNSLGSGMTTFDASANNKAVSDSNPGIFIFGDVTFKGGSVNVSQSGHNFGKITIDTSANNGAATIVEGGTLNLKNVQTGKGNFSATSANGDIIEAGGTGAIGTVGSTFGSVTLSAPNGAVTLDGTNNVGNTTVAGAYSLTAMKSSTLKNAPSIVLGTTSVSSGNITVQTTGANTDITQKSGATINAYGASSFTANGTGNVTLDQSGNQFGALTLATTSGLVTVKESTTMNLKAVTTSGKFTATSENGDIVDTASGSTGLTGATGASVFTAAKGNLSLANTKNDFATVTLNTAGNASIADINQIVFDASTIGGDLTVTAAGSGTPTISQTLTGALTVTGNATFLATDAASQITLTNTANQFGPVRFTVGSNGAVIDEATTFNLRAGSFATGAVTINTGGDFITSGVGGSSFTGSGLTIFASGTIIPSAGSLLVTGTFTVSSVSTKDLSALSKSGNLAGKDPVNMGVGSYVAPSP